MFGPFGNTTFAEYPVFRKDFRLLLKFMVAALAMQGLLILLVELLPDRGMNAMRREDVFPKIQIVISILVALVGAAHLLAEEREHGTDRFLFRLATPRKRIFQEKITAGVAIVLLTLVVQLFWGLIVERIAGIRFWAPEDIGQIAVMLPLTCVFAYLIGLPLALLFHRTIHVILVGMFLPLGGIWILRLPWRELSPEIPYLFYIFLAFTVPLAGLAFGKVLSRSRPTPMAIRRNTVIGLAMKQTRENMGIVVIMGAFILIGLASRVLGSETSELHFLVAFPILVLSAVLGVSTYTREEKQGGLSVLYHHPASRSRIFWVKFGHGLLGVLIIDLALLALILPPSAKLDSYGTFVVTLVLCGLIPYCCAALFTHVFTLPVYATVASLFAVPFVAGVLVYVRVLTAQKAESIIHSTVPEFLFPWPLFVIAVSLALSAWRAATDRNLLTGSILFRLTYVSRLFFFALAVAIIVTKTGWRDLVYLITNIDFGSG